MRRKIRKFGGEQGGGEAAFSADWCKGHFASHGRRALEAFTYRWQSLSGREPSWHSLAEPNLRDPVEGL
jgi:hypothetical protein